MIWPQLIPRCVCDTTVTVMLSHGLQLDGTPKDDDTYCAPCKYKETDKRVMTEDRRLVELSGTVYIPCDIAPGKTLCGYAVIGDQKYEIHKSRRAKNPDGSVNYVYLELIGCSTSGQK